VLMPLFVKTAETVQEAAKQTGAGENAPNAEQQKPRREFRLWDISGQVFVFPEEPNLKQLTSPSTCDPAFGMVAIPNDVLVHVLTDGQKDAVRVRLLTGERKDLEGWVCRSCVLMIEAMAS